ncbi:hypothetical protein [Jannaschia sp. CCS1]|uniref:hypothetical protein n=1 Tax=Jannaschia sp. (strain CCS1) TaxID=290400 RepID=UPI00006C002E|nr:hypothetical protein [Jannaschia sp. CCS1]ABD55095.1 hypothetical protein Jann_2178 [Jannaschia sp. CCS1]
MSWLTAGWQVFPAEPAVEAWVAAAQMPALTAAQQEPRRHGGTWCVGVDALPNDAMGRVAGGPFLGGAAYASAVQMTDVATLHRAQVSVTYPGYPGQDADESDANHRFRLTRDAAHLDGLLPLGRERRRHLIEPHAWILGVPLTVADPDAAPLVVWEGSHRRVRRAFEAAFAGTSPENFARVDVTDIYKEVRRDVLKTCARVEVPLIPGQSVLLHRMLIHGVAPWQNGARSAPEGRAIAYFRPCFDDPARWLSAP